MTYQLVNDEENNLMSILRTVDGKKSWIPVDNNNTDYQEYIAWTKASPKNVAAPADK